MNIEVDPSEKAIKTIAHLRLFNDAVVFNKGKPLWYRGEAGGELRFTKPVRGNFMDGRSITDMYYTQSQVAVVAPNTVEFTGKAREDMYTDCSIQNPRFTEFMYTQSALEARGVK